MNRSLNEDIIVSVRLMCFNQEKFIRQSIESILMQEVDFAVEVVVGDDFSTDNTLQIIREYQGTEYISIKILERTKGDYYWHQRNQRGRLFNYLDILRNCKGRYIALMDGDDYWTDKNKLKRQVNYLKSNPDFSIVSHEVHTVKFNAPNTISAFFGIFINNYKYGGIRGLTNVFKRVLLHRESIWMHRVSHSKFKRFRNYEFRDILFNKHFMATSSIMIRAEVVNKIGDWYTKTNGGHYLLVLIALTCGKGYHFPRFMGFHRLHENSISVNAECFDKIQAQGNLHDIIRHESLLSIADDKIRLLLHKKLECLYQIQNQESK